MAVKYLKISQLNRLLNDTLEMYIGDSLFEGELQEITRATSGHLYCTIKDELSALSIVLWASSARLLKFKPERGMLVRCQGKPNVYSKTGRLQMVVSKMEPAGEGALQQKFEELKIRLSAEGLFLAERKRALPFLPSAIGIISSAQGAVVHDIMTRLQDRMPHIPVFLVDVRVQGEGAGAEIAAGIKFLSESGKVDVLILARGGGSLQDLWCFNEEVVVRAIFASRIPVISAIGHEVDVTLADLVADLRAPTPTAAAEMVVPKRHDLVRILTEIERRLLDYSRWFMPKVQELDEISFFLERAVEKQFNSVKLKFEVISGRLRLLSPKAVVDLEISKLSNLLSRLESALSLKLEQERGRLTLLDSKLDPARRRENTKIQSENLRQVMLKFASIVWVSLEAKKSRLLESSAKLEALNPHSVLKRGYSITRKGEVVLTKAADINSADEINIQLAEGIIFAEVK